MSASKKFRDRLPRIRKNKVSRRKKAGEAPGTLHHVGEKLVDEVRITLHDYGPEHSESVEITELDQCRPYLEQPSKTWISVQGLHDLETLKSVWSYFNLHPLLQEDIVNTLQRPKAEEYDNNIFFVLRRLKYEQTEPGALESEQLSIVLGKNYVLSFQETHDPLFAPVLERLRVGGGRLRKLGPDYLAYALMDTIVDHYFGVLDLLGERMEKTEDLLIDDPAEETFNEIHTLRREAIFMRKSIWPLRDTLNSIIRDESAFIDEDIKIYLRDVNDHVVQIIDNLDNYRDMIMGMHDLYMTHASNKMNEVMKVLTIIATIFIPLTFIAGIYGMNFNPDAGPYNMPELSWYWGYPAIWAVMIVVTFGMIIYFKRKGWF